MGDTVPTRITAQALDGRLDVISEPLTAYRDAGVFGHRIATPTLQVQVLRPAESRVLPRNRHFDVGLFGAIELQLLQGPVFVEYDDEASARVLAVGETPKTEYLYYQATLHDPLKGNDVLSMIMMLRFMKTSSDLWAEELLRPSAPALLGVPGRAVVRLPARLDLHVNDLAVRVGFLALAALGGDDCAHGRADGAAERRAAGSCAASRTSELVCPQSMATSGTRS